MSQLLELINDLGRPYSLVAFFVLIGVVSSVITSVVKQIRKYFCHRQEIEFKREMLDRGMSAEEIESVVRAHHDQQIIN